MQRLPRELEACEAAAAVSQAIKNATKEMLWSGGTLPVVTIPFSESLAGVMSTARRAGRLHGGLENIQTLLQREEAGIEATKHRTAVGGAGTSKGDGRVSRLLLISNDGSERFYRACESLLMRYRGRLMGCKLNISGSVLGSRFFGKEALVKVAMVGKGDLVTKALLAIFDGAAENQSGSSLRELG